MKSRIRIANIEDIPSIFNVRVSVVENALSTDGLACMGITPESLQEQLQTTCKAWVAEEGGTVVGFSMADSEQARIWAMFVLPSHEGRGIGKRLMESATNWLWNYGHDEIWLTTDEDMSTRANGFYQHLGWTNIGKVDRDEVKYVRSNPGS